MKVRVWRYRVATEMRAESEREYGADGSRAVLFASALGERLAHLTLEQEELV